MQQRIFKIEQVWQKPFCVSATRCAPADTAFVHATTEKEECLHERPHKVGKCSMLYASVMNSFVFIVVKNIRVVKNLKKVLAIYLEKVYSEHRFIK